jgi:molybdate-binding protein
MGQPLIKSVNRGQPVEQHSTEIFMNWRSTAGKSALVKMLMKEHGFSKRKSEKAVNAVFNLMARALRMVNR